MPNLVGIGNSQVPTNAMLGGLAYQDSVEPQTIAKIKARTSDNAHALILERIVMVVRGDLGHKELLGIMNNHQNLEEIEKNFLQSQSL